MEHSVKYKLNLVKSSHEEIFWMFVHVYMYNKLLKNIKLYKWVNSVNKDEAERKVIIDSSSAVCSCTIKKKKNFFSKIFTKDTTFL